MPNHKVKHISALFMLLSLLFILTFQSANAASFSIWPGSVTPGFSYDNPSPIELGLKFRSDINGNVTGVRFFKATGATGTHIGRLWTTSGVKLAEVIFANESASGWQTATFSTPVAIQAGSTYIISYYVADGNRRFTYSSNYFATAGVDTAPLHGLQAGVDGPNSVYSDTGGFFNQTFNSSNYWVDVIFENVADTIPPTVNAVVPANSASNVSISGNVNVIFSEAMNAGTINASTVTLKDASNQIVPATVSYNSGTFTATLVPASALNPLTNYTLLVPAVGVTDLAGNGLAANYSSIFITGALAPATYSIWSGSAVTPGFSYDNPNPIELGLKFRADTNGNVTGVRFSKASGATGTHIGRLWTTGGVKLAEVIFANESASGWQTATFSTPVAIQAGTTYIISYYVADGNRRFTYSSNYFATAGVDTAPLHGLQAGVDGPNSVYSDTGGFFNQTFNSSNYWVDVIFANVADTTAPTVNAVVPANSASNVSISGNVNVIFSKAMNAGTINASTVTLKDASNQIVPVTVSYNSSTFTATLVPVSALNPLTNYTLLLPAGGVTDLAGNVLAANYSSIFMTETLTPATYSIWSGFAVTPGFSFDNPNPIELGLKFRADTNGNVTGVRFLKASGATGTHIGRLWTTGGVKLAEVIFANESASGWQTATFSTPVAIQAGTTYIISYYVADGNRRFTYTSDYFATTGVDTPPIHALQAAVDGANGVYSETGGFFNKSYRSSNYWVDVIVSPLLANDITPPRVQSIKPVDGSSNLRVATNATVYFSEPIDLATISAATIQLIDNFGNPVPATITYASTNLSATLAPIQNLSNSMAYTVKVKGGANGIKDLSGNALLSDYTWSFSTVGKRPPVDQAPGGPILVISNSADLYTRYYVEILRTEGFNEFDVANISQVTQNSLANYDVVILGGMALTQTQVTMLTNWVHNGGNLIAMRPDKQLQGLLGLKDASSTLSQGYLSIDVSTSPGVGITGQTLQFHGTADQYNLNGASALATLYSNATTQTGYPAVTLQGVGLNGGQAAAFTFDLARSIIYTHQGNPAWQINHVNPLQSYGTALDLFYDSTTPWVDFNRISIPQADEQQRFLANLILSMNSDKKPLPRFWYFPKGKKAVLVLTGDDHNTRQAGLNGDTSQFFNRHEAQSPIGCSVADWECVRSSSYLSPEDLSLFVIPDGEIASYNAKGFEVGLHSDAALASGGGWCGTWPSNMAVKYFNQIDSFMRYYASIPVQGSIRSHCYSWFGYTGDSSWHGYSGEPEVEANLGIHLDTNIGYGPLSWATTNPSYQMGSAMMMRSAQVDINGTMTAFLDIYNAGTQITDDNGQGASAIRTIVNSFLDAANGTLGFYGGIVVNMHSDNYYGWSYDGSDQVVASAQAHGVPIVSGRQMTDWLDGRNSSSFSSIIWNGTTLSFTINADSRARNLQAMLPTKFGSTILSGIMQNGIPIKYSIQIIKGIEYAFFQATPGLYTATY
ncbi:MAG: DUF4082 domain-containing protein [Methylococcaceae bacterium]|jgi:Domain of unknown function (DUF4082)/Bacterial Ig-like domain